MLKRLTILILVVFVLGCQPDVEETKSDRFLALEIWKVKQDIKRLKIRISQKEDKHDDKSKKNR